MTNQCKHGETLKDDVSDGECVICLKDEIRQIRSVFDAEQKKRDELTQQAVKAAVGVIMGSVVETIGVDGHQWSDRPCQTCKAVSGLIGRPFGCYWYQAKKIKACSL